MHRIVFALDAIDYNFFVYSNLCANELRMKHQSYPKSRRTVAVKQNSQLKIHTKFVFAYVTTLFITNNKRVTNIFSDLFTKVTDIIHHT